VAGGAAGAAAATGAGVLAGAARCTWCGARCMGRRWAWAVSAGGLATRTGATTLTGLTLALSADPGDWILAGCVPAITTMSKPAAKMIIETAAQGSTRIGVALSTTLYRNPTGP
jgi:hypothetical protein